MGVYTKERKGVTAEVHRQKDKERQKRMQMDVGWKLEDPESGGEAQTLGRPARDRGLPQMMMMFITSLYGS